MMRSLAGFLGVALFVFGLACDDPATDLTEWTLADHTHQTEKAQRQRRGPAPTKPTYTPPSKRDTLVDVTWQKQCANCHGNRGRGDGPQSPMVKAKDLTAVEWQATVSDEQLTESIKKGKGKMPAFNLPDSVIAGLVAHVRALPERAKKGFPQGRGSVGEAPATGAGGSSATGAPAAGSSAAGSSAASTAPGAARAPAAPAPAPSPSEEEDDEAESDNAH